MSSGRQSEDNGNGTEAHLFVLIHGLWGGPNHMSTIQSSIEELLPSSSHEKIVTLKPSSFRFWKTYDGLHLNASRITTEVFYEIEALKERNGYNVTKISIVGYSLGGLLARYMIGLLHDLHFFDIVQPVFFTTFATPHVGVEFFNNTVFDRSANRVGHYLFGVSGGELFMSDTNRALRTMADPQSSFYKGLERFQKHILLANVKNDRSVPFFTSYITENSPFDRWVGIKIRYFKDLPTMRIGKVNVRPKFVDLIRSDSIERTEDFEGNFQEETSFLRSNKFARVLVISVLAAFFLPVCIPVVLTSSLYASIYSGVKLKFVSIPDISSHWNRVKDYVYGSGSIDPEDAKMGQSQRRKRHQLSHHESFKGDTSELTENAMENFMYAEERLSGKSHQAGSYDEDGDDNIYSVDAVLLPVKESSQEPNYGPEPDASGGSGDSSDSDESVQYVLDDKKSSIYIDVNKQLNDAAVESFLEVLYSKDESAFPLFKESTKLPLKDDKRYIIENLNKLNWIKIPVYIDAWNSHDGIVARRGPKTNPKGTATIALWCSILRRHLADS